MFDSISRRILNWGPIVFLVVVPFASWFVHDPVKTLWISYPPFFGPFFILFRIILLSSPILLFLVAPTNISHHPSYAAHEILQPSSISFRLIGMKNGIRVTLRIGIWASTLACFLRLIPCYLSDDMRQVCFIIVMFCRGFLFCPLFLIVA